MKVKLFIFTLLALLLVSCTREPLPGFRERGANFFNRKQGKMVTISATMPPDTRVAYNDATRKLAWEGGDQLLLAGYDANGRYKGSNIYNWIGGDSFQGNPVTGATQYKAYYPGGVITLNKKGNVQLPNGFWNQEQNGTNTTGHLRNKLLLFDEILNPIDQTFNLVLKSSIVRYQLNNVPPQVGTLDKLVWTVEATQGNFVSMTLNVSGVTFDANTNSMTAFIAFDPDVMNIVAGGSVAITLLGERPYRWSTISGGGKDYEAGNRYAGTVNGGWRLKNPLIYVARYNINPAGNDFVGDLYSCNGSGYFKLSEAKQNINIAGYHLPSIEEWSSIVPYNHNLVVFNSTSTTNQSVYETVTVQGESISMSSDYRAMANSNITYALRYKGTDMVSAWRYEYKNHNTSTCHLMITSRNVASTVTIDNIADEPGFWNNITINGNDVIRYFPASGQSTGVGQNTTGLFWSSTGSSQGQYLLFNNAKAASNNTSAQSNKYTVRLFVPGDNNAAQPD